MTTEFLNQHIQRNNSSNSIQSNHSNHTPSIYNNANNNHRLSVSLTPASTPQLLQRHNAIASIYTTPNDTNSIGGFTPPTTPLSPPTPPHTPHFNGIGGRSKITGESSLMQSNTKAKATPTTTASDIIGSVLGDFGIWQLRSVLILFLCKLPASWFMACIIYTAPEIKPPTQYYCDTSQLNANQTISQNQCYVENWSENVSPNGSTTDEILSQTPCTHFVYEDYFYSFIMQYNLVCLREIFVAWTQYWHLFGVLVGGVIGTKAMLRISPRTVYIIGAVLQIILGVITGYSTDLTMHCTFRCLAAICCALMFTSAQAIFVDITGGRYRTGVIILYDTFWSLGVILLPGISSFFNNWSQLYLGITFPTVILLFLLQWTPESPRWLLKNGNEHDVYRVECMIRKAVDINERTFLIPDDFRQEIEKLRDILRSQKPPATWLELWRGPRATHYMLAAHIALACYIVNYMGMLLNLRSFGRDYRIPNTMAMGVAEIIGCFIALHFVMKQGQRKFMYAGFFNILAGFVGCLGWTFTHANCATGFVGKTLLEKLLWSFPQIAHIYILIREKSGLTVSQRYQDFVQHKIFERLRMHFPERLEKLVYLKGNIECDDFGLSSNDRQRLCAHVQIIFHSAATVRFNERLKVAARVNAIGTWHLLELCKEMPNLKSFVYVSTAYCNPGRKFVDELIYPTLPPVNWKMFVDCTNKIPDAYFNSLANYIKGPHPNTYTFTKSIAEQIVNDYKQCIPIVIVRPSIVTAAHREPYPGWIDNIQGITGIMMEIGKGTISSILGDKDIICDIIPVDFVVNSLILMAQKATLGRVYIANATSGVTNPITWARLGCLTLKWSRIYPTKRIMMYPNFKYRKSFLMHEIAVIILHYVPALLMDLLNLLRQKRKYVLPIAKKFRQACLAGRTFSLNEWIFKNQSRYYFEELLQQTTTLRQLSWNLEALDYDSYIREFVIGIQKYLHHEQFHERTNKRKITRLYWTWTFLHIFLPLLCIYYLL